MNRLTHKNMIIKGTRNSGKTLFAKIYSKLDKLEDLEEQLCCPLDVVFKALKDGIYYCEDEEGYQFRNNLRLEYNKNLGWGLVNIYGCHCRNDMPMYLNMEIFLLKDYKKNWWLSKTKEE